MTTFVALLRGINVGGRNRVAMADLRRVCETLGLERVRTYVQSGNVVFSAPRGAADAVAIGVELRERIATELDAAPQVVVRTGAEMAELVAGNPFGRESAQDPTKVHVAFTSLPADSALGGMEVVAYEPERLVLADRAIYLRLPAGIGRSPLAGDLARTSADPALTMRNWRSVLRLCEMARDEASPGAAGDDQ